MKLLASLLFVFSQVPSEADVKKAIEKLAVNQDDPEANLTVGKHLAFGRADWEKALPHLSKGSDKGLKEAAEKDLQAAKDSNAMERVAFGDAWINLARRFPASRKRLEERAVHWYAKAWPELDDLWKMKMRERLRRLFQNPPAPTVKAQIPIKGWTGDPESKGGPSAAAVHTGKFSVQITAFKLGRVYCPISQSVTVKPGTNYKLSCWVLTDGTDFPESLRVHIQDAKGAYILIKGAPILPDQPWWRRVDVEFEAGKEAVLAQVDVAVTSTQGVLYFDNFSVMGADGRELLKNQGFEEK